MSYEDEYWEHESNYAGAYGDDPGWEETVRTLIPFLPRAGTILEAGCANGYFLSAARRHGFHADGYDVSRYALARPAPGVEGHLFPGSLQEPPKVTCLGRGQYDVVCSWETFERIPAFDVPRAIRANVNRLATGGLFLHRIALADTKGIPEHGAYDDPTHLTLEGPGWWRRRFEEAGLWRRGDVEMHLNQAFSGRDWHRRFFAYQKPNPGGFA